MISFIISNISSLEVLHTNKSMAVIALINLCLFLTGPNAVEFIINHAEVSIAFVQENKIPQILSCLDRCSSNLKSRSSIYVLLHFVTIKVF